MNYRALSIPLILAAHVLGCGVAIALPPGAQQMTGVAGETLPNAEQPSPAKPPSLPTPSAPLAPRPPAEDAPMTTQLPPLLSRMVTSQDPELRARSVEGIAALAAPVAEFHLLRLSVDTDESVRHAASQALTSLQPEGLGTRFLDLLGDPESGFFVPEGASLEPLAPLLGTEILAAFDNPELTAERRALAAWCLGQMRLAEAFGPLQRTLWSDESNLAYACLDALYYLDDPRSADDWIQLSSYEDALVQDYAASAMARTPSDANVEALYQMASGQTNTAPAAQARAIDGLSLFPSQIAVPKLMMILRFNLPMQEQAMAALRKNIGFNVGRYPDYWYEWYEQESAPGGAFGPADPADLEPPPLVPTDEGSDLMNTVDFVPPDFQP